MEVIFGHINYLWALLIIPVVILIHFLSLKYSKKRAIKFANFVALARVSEKTGISSNYLVLFIRIIILVIVVLAIAGTSVQYLGATGGGSYVIAIDSSASMLASDISPNRLEMAKETASNFVGKLNLVSHYFSVVGFSGTSFVFQTLTNDKGELNNAISKIAVMKTGGTDIGGAIITSTNLLISYEGSKTIILLTDGRDNIGVDYHDAIIYANDKEVLIYTVGLGSNEEVMDSSGSGIESLGIDEGQLKEIAESTGGKYFSVASAQDLEAVYSNIFNSEDQKIIVDLTFILLIASLVLLSLEWLLINTRFRILP